jgi:hypothetical protein
LYEVQVAVTTYLLPTAASVNVADYKNATLTFAILGGVIGLAMGFAGGLAGGSVARGVVVGLGAQAVGALAGTVASLALVRLYFRGYVPDPNDELVPILIHGGIWMTIGAVGGAAFAIGLGCTRRLSTSLVESCVGAFLAALLFHALSASFFPDPRSTAPVADSTAVRCLAMFLVPILVAAGAARGSLGTRPRARSSTPGATSA